MKIITAPEILEFTTKSIFLAGSIEQDTAENWQENVISKLKSFDVTILNPRREEWDSSWVQSIENDEFKIQVNWELEALEKADFILMYFDPKTKSPISLLELGLFAKSGKMVVCCPVGFWRKGNVDIVCQKYNVLQFDNIDEIIEFAKKKLSL
ncbi:MAG: nucleoside 2-deoxyribosyltransferase domain-containing protein [Bacteroidales bacterium]|nr:nucleoside 2-deoxyribosyltransferase domain-containing protein [Bacteroidales bacterium]